MKKTNSYENLYYKGTVNVIGSDVFPRTFPLHWHNHVEIAVFPEGPDTENQPALHVNQNVYRMEPGDILFIWPGEVHEVIENTDGRLIGLQFSVALFNELPDFAPFFHLFRTFHRISRQDEPELARSIETYIRQMFSVQESGKTFSGVETVICLYEMFMDFGNHIKNSVLEGPDRYCAGAGRTFEKISAACSYITENCERELTLESAAACAGFSTCYFSRIFKRFTNYSFVEYLTLQRIKKAQQLLADSDRTVTEISYQAGFKSISTFNRVFKEYRGCSPSEYRKYYLR